MKTVVVIEVVERADGTKGLGNSLEISTHEAIAMIRAGLAKAPEKPIGEIPEAWEVVELNDVAVEAVENGGN